MNPVVTHPRTMGIGERVAYGVLMAIFARLAARGIIPPELVEYLALGIISGVGGVIGWWINRPKVLIEAAAKIEPGTVIVTTPEIAAATPDAPNVVSSTEHKVVNK